jgi:DNA-directed RNA polymerase subunit L
VKDAITPRRENWLKITSPRNGICLKINILMKTSDELRLEIEGEGHTFCNLLQNTLVEERGVKIAGYDMPHPLTLRSVVYLKVKKDADPSKVLERALKKMTERTDEFLTKFRQATGSP